MNKIKDIIENLVFAWRCWGLYKKIKEAKNSLPNIADEQLFREWLNHNLDYLLVFVKYTETEMDDVVCEQAKELISNNWDLFYKTLTTFAKGENPTFGELTTIVSTMSEKSKVETGTTLAVLLLVTNLVSIVQKRKENNDGKIIKRLRRRKNG